MLGGRKINCKEELVPNIHDTIGQIGPWDWCRVPCIQKKSNCLQNHPNRSSFIADDVETLVKITVDSFDKQIMAREHIQLSYNKSMTLQNTLKNLLSLSITSVWQMS